MNSILILSHVFPPATDGGSWFLYQLAKNLSRKYQISVLTSNCYSTDDFVTPHTKTISKTSSPVPQTQIYRLPILKFFHRPLRLIHRILRSPSQNPFITGPILSPVPFIRSVYQIFQNPPQIIISGPLPTTMPIYGHFLSKLFSAKHIILPCFHTNDQNFYHPWLTKTLRSADLLLPFTEFEYDFYQKKLKISPQKLYQYSGGIEKSFFTKKRSSPKRHLLFLGNHSAHKGIELLLKAYSTLAPKTNLIIAGKKTLYTPQIQKTFQKLPSKIKSQIKFITNFNLQEKKKLLDQAHFLILPSQHESFGLVLVEALARKTPFLVSDLLATKELAKKTKGGLTFKLDSPKDLERKITEFLKDPALTTRKGQMGYNYVKKNLLWQKIISDFDQKCLSRLLK